MAAALPAHVSTGQALFGKDHVLQQRGEEIAARTGLGWRKHHMLQAKAARKVAHHAVNRAAFLGATGEINAPHPRSLGKFGARQHLVDKLRHQRPECGKLRRKTKNRGPAHAVRLILHSFDQRGVKAFGQKAELPLEVFFQLRVGLIRDRQGKAPDLGALLLSQVSKILGETMQQIAFGDQDVDRQTGGKRVVQLREPRAD